MSGKAATEGKLSPEEVKSTRWYVATAAYIFCWMAFCFACLCCIAVAGLVLGSIAVSNDNNGNSGSSSTNSNACPCTNGVVVLDPLFIENVSNPSTFNKLHGTKKYITHKEPNHFPLKKYVGLPSAVSGGPIAAIYQKTGRVVTVTIQTVNYTSDAGVCDIIFPLDQWPSSILPLSNAVAYPIDPQLSQTALSYTDAWEAFFEMTADVSTSSLYVTPFGQCTGLNFSTPSITFTYLTATTSGAVKQVVALASLAAVAMMF